MIDKQIDGVYDLEVVDVHRHTFHPGSISHEQPLLNAVRSEPVLDSAEMEEAAAEETKNAETISFQDSHVYTDALIKA